MGGELLKLRILSWQHAHVCLTPEGTMVVAGVDGVAGEEPLGTNGVDDAAGDVGLLGSDGAAGADGTDGDAAGEAAGPPATAERSQTTSCVHESIVQTHLEQ